VLSGARLESCLLTEADLTESDLTGADFTGANLSQAKLQDARLDNADFKGAHLDSVRVKWSELSKAKSLPTSMQNCSFDAQQMEKVKLTGINLSGSSFWKANLKNARFRRCSLERTSFHSADLSGASLAEANLTSASMLAANLTNVKFTRAIFNGADLTESNVAGADFYEAELNRTNFEKVRGMRDAKNLATTLVPSEVRYFESIMLELPERFCDWERARIFGRLPLFTASYTAVIVIPVVAYGYSLYNEGVVSLRQKAEGLSNEDASHRMLARFILDNAHFVPMPAWSLELLVATVLLAIASTIYAIFCPSRVKEFSRDRWCDELGKSVVHYCAHAWTRRWLRVACLFFYVSGGVLAAVLILTKIVNAGAYIYESIGWTFLHWS